MTTRQLLDQHGQAIPPVRRSRAQIPGALPGSWMGGMGGAFAYDAANMFGQESAEWNPILRSPDAAINLDRDRMAARGRDLFRNDGWAHGGVTRVSDNVIGAQFRLVAKPDYRALARYGKGFDAVWADEYRRAMEAEWRMWADDPALFCDAARKLTITQMLRLAFMHQMKDGEALGMLLWAPERREHAGARYSTVLQLIHPDRLSNPYQQMDTHTLRGGVEIDQLGAPIAYHIRQAHQFDYFDATESMVWDRFPRETDWGRPIVLHCYDFEDAGQHRGLGMFNSVLNRFRMLSRYDGAELQQALLQTIFATFITSPYDADDVEKAMAEGGDELSKYQDMRTEFHEGNPITLGGVRLPVLAPGEEPKTVAPTHPNAGYDAFQSVFIRNIAAAAGLSAEQVSLDYSKTNYSSSRSSMLEAWKTLSRRRTDFGVGFANPIYCAFAEEIHDRHLVPLPKGAPSFVEMRAAYARCRWIGPARGWIDPVAERQGAVLGLDAGFGTLEQECAEQGQDWEETLDQRQVERRAMTDRDLPFPQWAAGAPINQVTKKPDAE